MLRPQLFTIILFFFFAGCLTDFSAPAGAQLLCDADSDCPPDYECKEAVKLCFKSGASDSQPQVTNLVTSPDPAFVGLDKNSLRIEFDVNMSLQRDPGVILVWGGSTPTTRTMTRDTSSSSGSIVYDYSAFFSPTGAPDLNDPQGQATLSITVISANGVQGGVELPKYVEFDFQRPTIAVDIANQPIVDRQLIAGVNNPLRDLQAVTVGTQVRISFVLSEFVNGDPIVYAQNGATYVPFTKRSGAGVSFTYEVTWDAAAVGDGNYDIFADVEDRAGNAAHLLLDTIAADVTVPATPTINIPGAIVFERIPWGSDQTNGDPGFFLVGGPGSVEANATVIVYSDFDIETAAEITRAQAQADGSFGGLANSATPLQIPITDRPNLYIAVADNAGNISDDDGFSSGPQATLVRDIRWVATLGGKISGSNLENPHDFETRTVMGSVLEQRDALASPDVVDLAQSGGGSLSTTGGGTWRKADIVNMGSRAAHAMVYDSARGRMVSFGGFDWDGCDGQTACALWERRGLEWYRPTTTDPEGDFDPPQASGRPMAYDSRRTVTVLLTNNGTWEWNGTSWRKAILEATSVNPLPLFDGHRMTYDSQRGMVLLFGGRIDGSTLAPNTLFGYDGKKWQVLCAAPTCGGPSARREHVLVHDSKRGETLLFGGISAANTLLGDLWVWNGTSWTQRCLGGTCASAPVARSGAVGTFDVARSRTVVFGGCTNVDCDLLSAHVANDVWEWTGTQWEQKCTSLGCVVNRPDPRLQSAMSYDVIRGKTLLANGWVYFGGPSCEGSLPGCNSHWEWDGTAWEQLDASAPWSRREGAIAYDPVNQGMLIFGGRYTGSGSCPDSANALCNDTWLWNGFEWRELSPATVPFERNRHSMATHTIGASGNVVMVAGTNSSFTEYGDVWLWNGTNWDRRCDGVPALDCLGLIYNPSRAFATMAGGMPGMSVTGVLLATGDSVSGNLNDSWLWGGSTWSGQCTGAPCNTTKPSVRLGAGMAFSPSLGANGEMVLVGGAPGGFVLSNEVWYWNGSRWFLASPELNNALVSAPHARAFPAVFYDTLRDKIVVYGGGYAAVVGAVTCVGNSPACDDTWEWDGAHWQQVRWADPEGDGSPTVEGQPIMAYDMARDEGVLLSQGTGALGTTWIWNGGGSSKPGQVFRFNFGAAGTKDNDIITDIEVNVRAGGLGYPGASPTSGAFVYVWDTHIWRQIGYDNVASPNAPATLNWTWSTDAAWNTDNATTIRRLFIGNQRQLAVAVAPIAENGSASDFGQITTDYGEVVVHYRVTP